MGSLVNPKPWVPYLNNKDCSQGFCSLYCPQWCYIIFPPPPPIEFPTENPSPNFSPLIIAIIGILASAFLLVSYYAIISKYFGNNNSSRRRENHDPNEDLERNEDPSGLEPWHVANNGLDEAVIKSITICKYKREIGLIEGTDCSVCLGEFEENESLRLLPKCDHAFHVVCIDTWLKSHSNCPLCRANIVSVYPPPPPNIEIVSQISQDQVLTEDIETGTLREEETLQDNKDSKEQNKDFVIDIRDGNFRKIKRSVSMDNDRGQRLSIADVLLLKQEVDFGGEKISLPNDDVGSSKRPSCDSSPLSMKRSLSSGTFLLAKRSRE